MENLFRDKDKELVDRLLNFSSGLVIHDSLLAQQYETNNSARMSSIYLGAYFKYDNNNELSRENITNNYKDLNKYYSELKEKYDIEPAIARITKDLSILKSLNNTLDKNEENLFYECYYECLRYYKTVTVTKAFNNQPDKRKFIKLFLQWSTIQKFLTRTLDDFFNIDLYDERTLKNAFISVGLDYFETLPIYYQRRLLKNINDIIKDKGTNKCIIDIIETFGLENVKIFKYILAKGYKTIKNLDGTTTVEPYLTFYKTPHDKTITDPEAIQLTYEEVTGDDIYWDATASEILQEDFNIITTKYLSVDSVIDATKDTLKLSYFIFLLNYLESNIEDRNILLKFTNTNISNEPIRLFDAFVTLISLVIKINGYKDLINSKPDNINYINGYNNMDNKLNIRELLDDIIFEIYNDSSLANKEDLINFFDEQFVIKGFNSDKPISIALFMEVFNHNESMREQLENIIRNTQNKSLLDKVQQLYDINMKSHVNQSLFGNFTTYSEFLLNRNYDLYNYIQATNEIMENDEKRFYYFRDKIFEISESISNYIYDNEVSDAINKSPYIGITNYLQYYIKTLVTLFKSYTVDLISSDVIYKIDDNINDKLPFIDDINDFEFGKDLADLYGMEDHIMSKEIFLSINEQPTTINKKSSELKMFIVNKDGTEQEIDLKGDNE